MIFCRHVVALLAFAMSSSPISATGTSDDVLSGIDYSFSEIASPPTVDELPPTLQVEERADWFMAEQLRRTEATSSNPNSGALASGWIDRNLYVLVEQGRITYMIRRPDPIAGSRPATGVCKISIATRETGFVFPDIIAGLSESERGCEAPPPLLLKRLIQARPRTGNVTDQVRFVASEGFSLNLQHLTNANVLHVPLVAPDNAGKIRSIYQMPTSWLLARKTAQQAWIVENEDETYGLVVKFDIERAGRQSGCLVEANDGRFPSLDWISDEMRNWCKERDRSFARSLRSPALEPRPSPPQER